MKTVFLDARCGGYAGEPVRVLGATLTDSGRVLVQKTANYNEPVTSKDDTLVIVNAPELFNHWGLLFNEQRHMNELIQAYLRAKRSNLIKLHDNVRMYNPQDVLQTAKMREKGQELEFDSGVSNGHMAVLFAIWGAYLSQGGGRITAGANSDDFGGDDEKYWLLPFSI